MVSTPAQLRAVAPNLKDATDDELQAWLDMASEFVAQSVWGGENKYNIALTYFAAHLATISQRGGKGEVTSESAGMLSRSYAASGNSQEALGSTSYGSLYASLCKGLVIGPTVLGGCYVDD